MENSEKAATPLSFFECKKCQNCCRQEGFVYLKDGEAEKIAGFLDINSYDFADKFCELLDRKRLVLKKKKDEVCIFLNQEGCKIYPFRPKQCWAFPVFWRDPKSLDYCQGLKNLPVDIETRNSSRGFQ